VICTPRYCRYPVDVVRLSGWPLRMITFGVALLALSVLPAGAEPPELLERGKLRVCADGNNLPFSNRAGEGFENRIAEMMAEDLGLELTYVWAPQVMGFVRNTLELRVCDVIIGVSAGYGLVQNTNAYYRSVYTAVLPHDADFAPAGLADENWRGRRVGAVTDTPPLVPLRRAGAEVRSYPLQVDTRATSTARAAVDDVAEGRTEAAVVWGPIAGFFAARHEPSLKAIPLDTQDADTRLDYRITMGIRRNEPTWKDWINDFIARRQDDINKVLAEYDVPLLDSRGELIEVAEPDEVAD
jgi:quinoprotein dehydrogenase-associated probable ABC transporter substrate-binding protein